MKIRPVSMELEVLDIPCLTVRFRSEDVAVDGSVYYTGDEIAFRRMAEWGLLMRERTWIEAPADFPFHDSMAAAAWLDEHIG